MTKILIVEDNEAFRAGAETFFKSRSDLEIIWTRDYAEAFKKIYLPQFQGALVDCFFPCRTGSGDLNLGQEMVRLIAQSDSRKRDSPLTGALTNVGNLLGKYFAKLAAKNAGVNYSQSVNPYWALEKAMEESEHNQPLGVMFAEDLERNRIPFVLVTSTNHHDELTQPIQDYVGRKGWTLVDCSKDNPQQKASPEFWQRAYSELARRM